MNQEIRPIAPVDPYPRAPDAVVVDYDQGGGDPKKLLRFLLRSFEGRLKWAIPMALVLGAAGAYVGWNSTVRRYTSVAVIDIRPRVPRILYDSENSAVLPMFDAYVESQAALLKSPRVAGLAMQSAEWKSLGRPVHPGSEAVFLNSLEVFHPKRTQNISVIYTDLDPKAAQICCQQVVRAYLDIANESQDEVDKNIRNKLEETRNVLNTQIADIKNDITAITEKMGPDAVQARYSFQVQQLNRFEAVLSDNQLKIIALESQASPGAPTAPAPQTPEEVALVDAAMERLVLDRFNVQGEIEYLENFQHRGANHPEMVAASRKLEGINRQIEARMLARATLSGDTPDGREKALADLRRERETILQLRDKADREVKDFNDKIQRIQNLQAEMELVKGTVLEIKNRIEQINMESTVGGRAQVLSDGDFPYGPSHDKRSRFAIAGLAGGFGLTFALVLLLGLRDRRVRRIEDLDGGELKRARVLGVMPELPDGNQTDVDVAMANHCIHHIRTLLQLHTGHQGNVIAVTSATAGAGKTTLGMALGLSYSAAGSRTLLVDFDLVGRGLTKRLKSMIRRRVTRALAYHPEGDDVDGVSREESGIVHHLLDSRKLQNGAGRVDVNELRARSEESGDTAELSVREIGAMLDVLARQESAESRSGRNGNVGLLDALQGKSLDECVLDSGVHNLSVLTVGRGQAVHAGSVSPAAIHELLRACVGQYDNVVVDTGPILGGLEASVVSQEADAVVLVVRNGEERTVSDEAINRLHGLRARMAGVVLNRAETDDVMRSSYSHFSRPDGDRPE